MLRVLYIICLICCLSPFGAAGNTIQIDAAFRRTEIYNALTAQEPDTLPYLQLDFNLKNVTTTERTVYLSIINPTIDSIEVKTKNKVEILGDHINFKQHKIKHNNHVAVVSIAANSTEPITLKIKKQWKYTNIRVMLSSQNAFIKTTNHDNFFLGIYFGIVFMFILLLICFYIFSKSKFFLIYLSINIFILLIVFQYSGVGFIYIWPNSIFIQNHITAFAVMGYLGTHYLFIRSFFSTQFKSNYSNVILNSLIYILLTFVILFLFQLINKPLVYQYSVLFVSFLNTLFVFYGLIILLLCFYSYNASKRREIIWVFIAATFHIFNWFVFINTEFAITKPINIIDNFKLVESNLFVPHIIFYTCMLEIFITSIFIGISYHQVLRQNTISTQRLDFLQKRNINTFVVGQEAEREKISSEIEHSITNDIQKIRQKIAAFSISSDERKIIPTVINEIDKTVEDIKNITNNYVAPDLQQMSLISIVTTATDKLFSQLSVQYVFHHIGEDFVLHPIANINLYRILQEISNNILKHAQAQNVTIFVTKDNKSLQMKITDDGVGFGDSITNSKGIGIMNIESRVSSLNGHFYILSNANKGAVMDLIFYLNDIT